MDTERAPIASRRVLAAAVATSLLWTYSVVAGPTNPAEPSEDDANRRHYQSLRTSSAEPVATADGDDSVAMEDVVLDLEHGRVHYFAVRDDSGLHALSPSQLLLDGDDARLRWDSDSDAGWGTFDSTAWPLVRTDDRGAPTPGTRFQPASALLGHPVEDAHGREIGTVDDVLIDHDAGHRAFLVVSFLVVPWNPEHPGDRVRAEEAEFVRDTYAIPLAEIRQHPLSSVLKVQRVLPYDADRRNAPFWSEHFDSPATRHVQAEARSALERRRGLMERRPENPGE